MTYSQKRQESCGWLRHGQTTEKLENIAKFHTTPHFARRIAERTVSFEAAKAVVKYSEHKQKQYTGEHGGVVFRFSKTVDGVKIVVVAELKKKECWLITGFYE